jgi:hypothetical protein
VCWDPVGPGRRSALDYRPKPYLGSPHHLFYHRLVQIDDAVRAPLIAVIDARLLEYRVGLRSRSDGRYESASMQCVELGKALVMYIALK